MSALMISGRKLVGVGLLGGGTLLWAGLCWSMAGENLARALAGYAPLILSFGLATLAVARGWWWGRMLGLGLGVYSILDAACAIAVSPSDVTSLAHALAGVALLASLLGRRMFDRYEGTAPARLPWTAPGMGVVRWALIAGVSTVLAAATELHEAADGLGLYGTEQVLRPVPISAFVLTLVFALILVLGLALLALQRTAGLLVVAAATLALSATMIRELVWGSMAVSLAVLLAPGLATGWAAVVVWGPRLKPLPARARRGLRGGRSPRRG
jgi:hypothetical protein